MKIVTKQLSYYYDSYWKKVEVSDSQTLVYSKQPKYLPVTSLSISENLELILKRGPPTLEPSCKV